MATNLDIDIPAVEELMRLGGHRSKREAVDAAVREAMDGLALGAPVPAQVAQPFTLLVLPRAAGYEWACPAPGTRP